MDRRAGTPCRTCGQRPSSGGKIKRWAENLKDSQVVDLVTRLNRSLAQSESIEPENLRAALVTFVCL